MNENDKIRFSRQVNIKNWGEETQERLQQSTVFIAGCGGLGSPVIYYLAACGIGSLKVVDYDEVELSNLNRQIIHGFNNISDPKVKSAKESVAEFNPDMEIIAEKTKITSKNCADLIDNADIVIDCLDNFNTRHILNEAAAARSIPLVHCGIEEFQGQLTFIHVPETPCLACFLPMKDAKTKPNVIGATAGIMGSMQALEAIKYLAGFEVGLKNKLLFFDGTSMEMETMNLTPNPKCKVCRDLH